MSRWRWPLVAALAWLAVVAVGSAAVWWVISSVGEDLGPGRSVTAVVPGGTGGRAPGGGAPGPSATAGPSAPPGPSGTTPPGSASGSASGPSSGGQPPGSPGTSGSDRPAPTATHRETWAGRGGYLTVGCRGVQAGLVAAQPDPGYAVSVSDRGPQRVEVSFEGRTEDGGRRVEVRAECRAGRPAFQLSAGEGGGHDD
ncbi:hypothetical protein [Nocardioides panaciterrulae]|uniref:Uncharacterized protein n=1 Tax=Nocardioides panaciterrulae TaxID=661492 RepID=A0A7Y9E8X0_9ACTN|nr:hypothetical protein [Nocardioides panaciterrulae]NYD43274.1 hypothetical protein [Nocardioides panaciterrulae]